MEPRLWDYVAGGAGDEHASAATSDVSVAGGSCLGCSRARPSVFRSTSSVTHLPTRC